MTPDDVQKFKNSVMLFVQAIAAQIELSSMQVANLERTRQGLALAYDETAIAALTDKYGLGWNSVITLLNTGL